MYGVSIFDDRIAEPLAQSDWQLDQWGFLKKKIGFRIVVPFCVFISWSMTVLQNFDKLNKIWVQENKKKLCSIFFPAGQKVILRRALSCPKSCGLSLSNFKQGSSAGKLFHIYLPVCWKIQCTMDILPKSVAKLSNTWQFFKFRKPSEYSHLKSDIPYFSEF